MKILKWSLGLTLIGILVAGGLYFFNRSTLQQPVVDTVRNDERNRGIEFDVHYKNYTQTSILVFDLKGISGDNARVDVFRVFLQTSDALKEKNFETVELAFRGNTKFTVKGGFFNQLGREYGEQNVVYTIRTFPENLYKPDGARAYAEQTGGMLAVMNAQMEDFNDFHDQWYLNELLKEQP